MKIGARQADHFASRPDPQVRAVLVYGPDSGLIRERINLLTRSVVDDLSDPFRIADLSDSDLRQDPARLADEAAAISMLGGRRVIRVRGAGDSLTKVFDSYLSDAKGDALLLIDGGELTARSSLRKLFEDGKETAAIACYADNAADLAATIHKKLSEENLTIEPAALHYLTSHLGSDRGVTMNELEKLVLYMGASSSERRQVLLDDVRACVGDNVESSLDAVIDAAVGGEMTLLDVALARARSADVNAVAILNALTRHLIQLHLAMANMENGQSPESIVQAIRPMVHFARKPKLQRQLMLWNRTRIERAMEIVAEADRQCKTTGLPEKAICGQTLLRIAQAASTARR